MALRRAALKRTNYSQDWYAMITIGYHAGLAACENSISDLTDEVNKLIADVADVKQLVNSVVDQLQSAGLLA